MKIWEYLKTKSLFGVKDVSARLKKKVLANFKFGRANY